MRKKYVKGLLQVVVLVLCVSVAAAQNYCAYLSGGANGQLSNIAIPPLNLSSLPVTIEAWFKPVGAQNDYASIFFSRSGSATPTGIFTRSSIGNQLRSNWCNTASTTATPLVVSNNVWHHAALVVTASSRKLYLDGVLFDYQLTNNVVESFDTQILLGWDDAAAGRTFKGYIDEVRVWSVERSATDLDALRFKTLRGNESGLVGYWSFDDGGSTIAKNAASVGGHDGVFNGASCVLSDVFAPMEFVSATSWQPTGITAAGATNAQILRLRITTRNTSDSLHLRWIDFLTKGTTSTANIHAARVYYTGNDSLFSAKTAFASQNGGLDVASFRLSGDQALSTGDNYFWLVYDVATEATDAAVLDAECVQLYLEGSKGLQVAPLVTAPAGSLSVLSGAFIGNVKLPLSVVTTKAFTRESGANFVSFQQDVITSFAGYQYVCYWNTAYRVCIARRKMPAGEWQIVEFADYTATAARVSDNHYSISMGICKKDGTIHVAFDHHGDNLHYRRSVVGLATSSDASLWRASSFSGVQNYLVANNPVALVTYPRFVSKPDGNLLYECRLGTSGSGDSYLWEYDAATAQWTAIGKYIDGISLDPDQNAYINGIHYDVHSRLHVSWVWRVTPDPVTNHDVYYAYSDDNGRTWFNAQGQMVGTVGTNPMSLNTAGLKVVSINQNRGLINQESQVVDSKGGIHILQSYMRISESDNSSNFWASRDKAYLRHIYRNEQGVWQVDEIPAISRNRSQIAIDASDNLYVVCPNYRVYFAAASTKWQQWTTFDETERNSAINEGLIDREALLNDGVLSFAFAQTADKVIVPYYLIDKLGRGTGKGLRVAYFAGKALSDMTYQCVDSVNRNWNTAPFDTTHAQHYFGVRCAGELATSFAEAYTLYITCSGSLRVKIGDSVYVSAANNSQTGKYVLKLPLQASHRYDLQIDAEFAEQDAVLQLEWESARQQRAVVPCSALYAADEFAAAKVREYVLALHKGWNLIGIGFSPVADDVAQMFPNAQTVKTNTAFYRKDQATFLNSLQTIAAGEAYLVYNSVDEQRAVMGLPLGDYSAKLLPEGWSLLAYPLQQAGHVSALLPVNSLEYVKDFDSFYEKSITPDGNLLMLQSNSAYYVKMLYDGVVRW